MNEQELTRGQRDVRRRRPGLLRRSIYRALARITRDIQHFPGRWRVISFLTAHSDDMRDLPPALVQVAPGYWVGYPPTVTFDVYVNGLTLAKDLPRPPPVISPGDNVLDIGANIGHNAIEYAIAAGSKGHVHAFEASPLVVPHLRDNVRRNTLNNITVHACAVADRAGHISFNIPREGASPLGSMRSLGGKETRAVDVQCVTIDSMLNELGHVSFVKIDVEGAELLVLRGMEQLIARDRPVIQAEMTDAWMRTLGGTAESLCKLLSCHGYALYSIEIGSIRPLAGPPREQVELLAIPNERVEKILGPTASRAV